MKKQANRNKPDGAGPKPKTGIMDIAPYIGGEASAGKVRRLVRLASNENALGASPRARAAYLKKADDLFRYPDGSASALRRAIAGAYGIKNPDSIVCGSGSDELINLLLKAYAGKGDEVLYSRHGFLMYPIGAKSVGATPVAAPERNLRTDVDALLAAVSSRTKIVFLANPNNPTGSYLTKAEVSRLHARLPAHVLLVVDAAYAEFAGSADYSAGDELVRKFPNAVVLRTFSKIYGLAALRLGWAHCPPGVADVLNRVRGPFNVGAAAQAAGIAALSDGAFLRRSREHNTKWRAWLVRSLDAMGVKTHPSAGNFVLADFGPKAEAIRLGLKERGVLIRQMGAYGLPHHLRITVGTAADMRLFKRHLTAVLKEQKFVRTA